MNKPYNIQYTNICNGIFHISIFKALLINECETIRGEREKGKNDSRGEREKGKNDSRGEREKGKHDSRGEREKGKNDSRGERVKGKNDSRGETTRIQGELTPTAFRLVLSAGKLNLPLVPSQDYVLQDNKRCYDKILSDWNFRLPYWASNVFW
jgi:hypothetical protein